MKVTIELDITSCKDCPFLKSGKSYGNDGRDGNIVYYCKKNAFGKEIGWGNHPEGFERIPNVPPHRCVYFKSEPMKRVADRLGISNYILEDILKIENCKIVQNK